MPTALWREQHQAAWGEPPQTRSQLLALRGHCTGRGTWQTIGVTHSREITHLCKLYQSLEGSGVSVGGWWYIQARCNRAASAACPSPPPPPHDSARLVDETPTG